MRLPPQRERTPRRGRTSIVAALVLVVVAVVGGGAASAGAQQEGPSPPDVAKAFARAWSEGSGGAIESLLARDGVSLRLDDAPGHVGVMPRQAAASIGRLLARHENSEARVRRSEVLGGEPARAFAELDWMARPRGTHELSPRVIFLGLERSDAGWSIVEIRVLR